MKKFFLQIPEPCHEDWNKMTPVEKGRYCNSCCKQVIDFTLMSDKQIIDYFSKAQDRTCGHFANDQLNRVLKAPATPAKKNAWAIMLSFLLPVFAWNKATAQGKVKVDTVKEQSCIKMGKVMVNKPVRDQVISGKVTDENGNPVVAAAVIIKGTRIGTTTNDSGQYTIRTKKERETIVIVSSLNFREKEIIVNGTNDSVNKDIILAPEDRMFAGEVVVVRKRPKSIRKKIVDTLLQSFEPFKINIFPNPVSKGGTVSIKLKNIASYDCYLIDNQGNVIEQPSYTAKSKHEGQFQLLSSIATGIYYITVVDKRSKKKHTEKIVVQ